MESKNPNKTENGGSRSEHSPRNLELPLPSAGIPRVPGEAWVEERTRVAVGRNITVSGRLVFQEPVRIEGCFRGEVSSIDLVVIATGALVEGQVRAPRLLILGELRGDVCGAVRLVVGPSARVHGRIETRHLTVCEGAYLNGYIRMPQSAVAA